MDDLVVSSTKAGKTVLVRIHGALSLPETRAGVPGGKVRQTRRTFEQAEGHTRPTTQGLIRQQFFLSSTPKRVNAVLEQYPHLGSSDHCSDWMQRESYCQAHSERCRRRLKSTYATEWVALAGLGHDEPVMTIKISMNPPSAPGRCAGKIPRTPIGMASGP